MSGLFSIRIKDFLYSECSQNLLHGLPYSCDFEKYNAMGNLSPNFLHFSRTAKQIIFQKVFFSFTLFPFPLTSFLFSLPLSSFLSGCTLGMGLEN